MVGWLIGLLVGWFDMFFPCNPNLLQIHNPPATSSQVLGTQAKKEREKEGKKGGTEEQREGGWERKLGNSSFHAPVSLFLMLDRITSQSIFGNSKLSRTLAWLVSLQG